MTADAHELAPRTAMPEAATAAAPNWFVETLLVAAPTPGATGACLVWRFPTPMRCISSAVLGGGITSVTWVLNMSVDSDYARLDPRHHLLDVARDLGLDGPGVALMTAVDVASHVRAEVDGAAVDATVGVRRPVWPAGSSMPAPTSMATPPGTINLVAAVPVRFADGALVNAVGTMTEAKVQALLDAGIDGTGTASDAVCLVCTLDGSGDPDELFGGPRSTWGSRLADATYDAVRRGVERQRT